MYTCIQVYTHAYIHRKDINLIELIFKRRFDLASWFLCRWCWSYRTSFHRPPPTAAFAPDAPAQCFADDLVDQDMALEHAESPHVTGRRPRSSPWQRRWLSSIHLPSRGLSRQSMRRPPNDRSASIAKCTTKRSMATFRWIYTYTIESGVKYQM